MILILSVSLIFIHELCQSLLWKNYVALNYGKQLKLYMVMLGCTPEGRLTEQHEFFLESVPL
jgi:hypothetical protein